MLAAIQDGHCAKSTRKGTTLIVCSASLIKLVCEYSVSGLQTMLTQVGSEQIKQHCDKDLFGDHFIYQGRKFHEDYAGMTRKEVEKKFKKSTVV